MSLSGGDLTLFPADRNAGGSVPNPPLEHTPLHSDEWSAADSHPSLLLTHPDTQSMKAVLNDVVVAESDDTVVVEGSHYFPPEAIEEEYFTKSDHRTTCPWKGRAHYYDVHVDGDHE